MTTDRKPVLDAAATSSYVLPAPPRTAGGVVVIGSEQDGIPSLLRGAAVARALGRRCQTQADSLGLFLGEVRQRLAQLDGAIAEDSRAQLKGAVRELVAVLDWCDAVEAELTTESARAVAGQEPVDLGTLCHQVAAMAPNAASAVVVLAEQQVTWWGDCAALADLIQQALHVVAERTLGQGTRVLEVGCDDGVPTVHVRGRGEPADSIDPEAVARFRGAAERVGALVVPDGLGVGGAGLVLRLPV